MTQAGPVSSSSGYQRGWRRILVDMEIPGWDERFLAEFDPLAKADLYARAGVSSVMVSCKALTGLCFWPTKVGEMHPGIRGRDVVGETFQALRERGIAACAYYSAICDNWASETHPEWHIEPIFVEGPSGSSRDRHERCCPNNPGYRQYISDQIADLYGRYDVDCAFCDMTFWPGVCGCEHCRARLRSEDGIEIPETIDWTGLEWCAFQAARERWMEEFQALVAESMRRNRPGIAVYHNFSSASYTWILGTAFTVAEHSDFLGGDFYGDPIEQLVNLKLMNGLSRSRPVEFMTFATTGADEHVRLKPLDHMRDQVLAASSQSAAFMFIDAVDPIGTANERVYDRIREAFEPAVPFEQHLGGEPIEDVGVYFSSESRMDFSENGSSIHGPLWGPDPNPHLRAVRGASRILQRSHVQFGVIARQQLHDLERYRVIVLPNVQRMDATEIEAIRDYLRQGGRVYASGYTSLVETRGVGHGDFLLADIFGVHLKNEEAGRVLYAKPATAKMRAMLDPQRHLTAAPLPGSLAGGVLRLQADRRTRVLATLSLPYGQRETGDATERNWASIHATPPWDDTTTPVIVERRHGAARVIYSALDIESEESEANDRLFAGLIGDLLDKDWSVRCETHPSVWVTAFRGSDDGFVRVSLFNGPAALVGRATLRLRPPDGTAFVTLEEEPSGRPIPFRLAADGTLRCTLRRLPELTMILARTEPA
jgi:hypothetical protein